MTSGATIRHHDPLRSDGPGAARRPLSGSAALALAGLLLAACDDADADAPTAAADPADADAPTAAADPASALTAASTPNAAPTLDAAVCPSSRVIAIRDNGVCPTKIMRPTGAWHGGGLFVADALPPALATVCTFTWIPLADAPPDLTAFGPVYSAVDSDCEVNWPQADALSELLGAPLRDAFYQQLGRLDGAAMPIGVGAQVMVALPDTSSRAHVTMNSDHADNLAGIIDSIACPPGAACHVSVERSLALPLLPDGGHDLVHGGFYGSQAALAVAIHGVVDAWQAAPGSSRLILNLSVGWEPGRFGGSEPVALMPAPVQAVYRALQHARCHDALIITAAGNTAGNDCAPGPLAPAIWEERKGPTTAACNGGYDASPGGDPSTQPLLYAVSGVDHRERPLQSTRPGGRASLAAPAFMAVADGDGGLTSALSGSSAAAAVVSGIAGLVWSAEPSLGPAQVIARIYQRSAPLTPAASADFGAKLPIRRVSVCGALGVACPGAALDLSALADAAADARAALAPTQLAGVDATDLMIADTCPALCSAAELFTSAAAANSPDVCDTMAIGGRDRYTNPQPSYPPCKVCFAASDTLTMVVSEEFDAMPVQSVLLEVDDGATTQRFEIGPIDALSSEDMTELRLPVALVADQQRATLHLTFAAGDTYSNAIAIY